MAMSNVQRIQCGSAEPRTRTRRVGAYCRVSTLLESQQLSLETQMEGFKQKIARTPGWKLVDIYADEGITGTSTKKRKEFRRMIQDAQDGKIDTIITKSISRFARNTLDCLKYVDDLKQIGVNVFFEKENIRTDDPTSNFQLALLGAISQDESNSIGLNRRWAYQQRFANGDYNIGSNRILGYDGVDGKLVPNQDAWIIREIFERYVAGESYSGICRALAEKGAKTLRGGKFTVEAVRYILSNETYVGDKHLMKQPPTDYLTHQPMKRSDYKDYYLTDDHEGIVSRELWDRAQAIKKGFKDNLKNGVMGAGEHHFLYGKVFCGECGAPFVRRTLKTKGGVYYKAWNCRERQKGQKGNGCRCRLISEESLIDEIVNALGWETMDEGRFNREVSRVLVSDDDVQVEC